jgi:dUTP pyrophosphatase
MRFLINPENEYIKQMYENHGTYHNGDSGLDLFVVSDTTIDAGKTEIVDLGIRCRLMSVENKYYSYLMYARSSISKTPLRLANGVGLIDQGYLGSLKMALHNTGITEYKIKKGERYVQLARPDLGAVEIEIVDNLGETSRKSGGFGSTGK